MNIIPLDILNYLVKLLKADLKTLLDLKLCCKLFNKKLSIVNLFCIEGKYLDLLTDDVLKKIPFVNVIKLNVPYNRKVTDGSFMKNLRILAACGNCGIDQNAIEGLDLVKLYVSGNRMIINISFMKKLRILDASGDCEIDQNDKIACQGKQLSPPRAVSKD